jgi:hypothetical protein
MVLATGGACGQGRLQALASADRGADVALSDACREMPAVLDMAGKSGAWTA